MKFRSSTVIVLVALTFVFSALVPLASADNDGMHVVILQPTGEYKGGEKAKVEVQVFEKEKRVDPDQTPILEFRTGYDYSGGNTRDITMVKKETGIYTADIEVYDSDIDRSSYGSISLKAQGNTTEYTQYGLTYGKANATDTSFDFVSTYAASGLIMFSEEQGLQIRLDFKNLNEAPWGPGEKVKFDIRVTENGKAVKPDEFKVGEDVSFSGDDDIYYAPALVADEDPVVNVLYQNPSDGYYQAEFTIPTLTEEHSFDITAIAKKGDSTAYDSFSVDIDMFLIWAHLKTPETSKNKDFDIWVSDQDGKKVAGASVTFDYYSGSYYSTRAFTYGEKNATTDSDGKCSFSFSDITDDLSINGEVKKDGKTQEFSGTIHYSTGTTTGVEEVEPNMYGFDVITQDDMYEATGSQVTHPFEAYYNGEALKSKDIYYYAMTSTEVLGFGVAKTDAKGEFDVNFKKPAEGLESVEIEFECPINYHPGVFVGYGWEDSDYDGFSDKFESFKDTDPKDADSYPNTYKDSDGDYFGDQYEEFMKTDPDDSSDYPSDFNDSDSDGFGDEFEVNQSTDPDDRWDHPSSYPDDDYDGHSNDEETFYGTDPDDESDYPHNSYKDNSDGDYVTVSWWTQDYQYDEEEKFYGTDPKDEDDYPQDIYGTDSDYDGVKDEEEKFYGTDPDDWYSSPKAEPSPWDERYSDHNSTDGWEYEEDSESISEKTDLSKMLSDDKVTIAVDKFNIGGKSRVTMSTEDEGYWTFAAWGIGDISTLTESEPEMTAEWVSWSGEDLAIYPVGDELQGAMIAPEFLPSGSQKYSIMGGYVDFNGETHVNYIVVRDGESKSSAVEDDDTILGMDSTVFLAVSISAVALLIIIIIVVIVVILVVKSKKKSPAVNTAPAPTQGADNLPPPPPAGFNPQGQPAPGAPPLAQPGAPAQTMAQPEAAPQQPATNGQTAAPPPDPTLLPQGQTSAQPGQPQVMDQGAYPPPPPPKQY